MSISATVTTIGVYLFVVFGMVAADWLFRYLSSIAAGVGDAGEAYVEGKRVQEAKNQGWKFDNV